jgi:hypothetical protein
LETHVEREIDPLLSLSIPMTLEIFFQKRAVFCKVITRDTFVEIENASTKLLSKVSRNLCLVSNTLAGNLVPRVCPLGETLAAAGHMSCPKFSARGCVGKVSNDINMLPVGYHV